uniref:Uncharacterized protein n=1 Tax=Lotharella globosa TaxID=91324 RepID=A0A7S4DN08_9EUKA
MAYYVLVGGEAHQTQGVAPEKRELMHTSLTYVASAYAKLRKAGVPRNRIITIVQLKDYIRCHKEGAYPRTMYEKECALLLEEGGADYDFEDVNPLTVWNVVLGIKTKKTPKVVPKEKGLVKSLTLAIYSHGDSHPTKKIEKKKDPTPDVKTSNVNGGPPNKPHLEPLKHEWYFHMPYHSDKEASANTLAFVATEAAKNPLCYVYATQLRNMFASLFKNDPERPVVCLLNYCRSGGGIEFLRRPYARKMLDADSWPLYLMSSCQANHDALVGGLWDAFFNSLSKRIPNLSRQLPKFRHDFSSLFLSFLLFFFMWLCAFEGMFMRNITHGVFKNKKR